MDIDVGDLREYYKILMCNAMSLFNHLPSLLKHRNPIPKNASANLVRIAKHLDMMSGQQLAAVMMPPMEKKMPFPTSSIKSTMMSVFPKYVKITTKQVLHNRQPPKTNGSFELQKNLAISEKKVNATRRRAIKR
jgi:hypothetical protein